jgi:hypothetical protein
MIKPNKGHAQYDAGFDNQVPNACQVSEIAKYGE